MKKIFGDIGRAAFLAALALFFILGVQSSLAATTTTWAPPTNAPGTQDISTPITDSSVGQVKDGGLSVGASLSSSSVGLEVLGGTTNLDGPVVFGDTIKLGGIAISNWSDISSGSANAITTDSSAQTKQGNLTVNGGLGVNGGETIGSGQFILPGGTAGNPNGYQSVFDWSGDGQNYIRGNTLFDQGNVTMSGGTLTPYAICMDSGQANGTHTCSRMWPYPVVTQRSASSVKVKSGDVLTASCNTNEVATGGGFSFGPNGGGMAESEWNGGANGTGGWVCVVDYAGANTGASCYAECMQMWNTY